MDDVPLEIERKLLIDKPDLAALEAAATSVSEIVQTYLITDEWDAERVRHRLVRDSAGERLELTHTRKRAVSDGVVEEDEHEIDQPTYDALLVRTDPARVPVVKTRYVVPWADRTLEVDRFHSPRTLWLLEVELPDVSHLHDELEVPTWIAVTGEVTGDPAYSNAALAVPPTP
jgi:CYTH domain-containing protein